MPAGKNPELMVYQKTSSLPIDLPWTDEEDNVGFSNDGMDGPDLKLAPISAGEYIKLYNENPNSKSANSYLKRIPSADVYRTVAQAHESPLHLGQKKTWN